MRSHSHQLISRNLRETTIQRKQRLLNKVSLIFSDIRVKLMSHEHLILETDHRSQQSEEIQRQEFYFENNQRQRLQLLKT